jgi:ubiquinone/menaquinone biosynthesis C-methylase UbiE
MSGPLLSPRQAYDRIAPQYRNWRWYRFWRAHEAPIVRDWLCGLRPGRGLDAGAGTGPYLSTIGELGHRAVAMDVSRRMLMAASAPGLRPPGMQVQGDVMALPFVGSSFTWLLCTRVLSHVDNPAAAAREFARVLEPGGECLVTDVDPDHPYSHVRIPHNGDEVAIETHKHSLASLRASFAAAGLRLEGLRQYRLRDLASAPPRTEFAKLYADPARPIFYSARLLKATSS